MVRISGQPIRTVSRTDAKTEHRSETEKESVQERRQQLPGRSANPFNTASRTELSMNESAEKGS